MNSPATCIVYTQDSDFIARMDGYLKSIARMEHIHSTHRIERLLQQWGPTVLIVDLHSENARSIVHQVHKTYPQTILIALGIPRSEPMLEMEAAGIFAVEDVRIDRPRFQKLIVRALDHIKLTVENQILREESLSPTPTMSFASQATPPQVERQAAPPPLRHLYRAFRHFHNIDALLESIVEGVASTIKVSRVGIFSWIRASQSYRLRAGLRCLEGTDRLEYSDHDPFVHWLELNAHIVSHSTLEHIRDISQRRFLKQILDRLGAEVLIPLYARTRIIGWLFVGHRGTGVPFTPADLEDLMIVAEHISTNLENALLYEDAGIQKNLLETLLQSMPTGIVAVDKNGLVQWFNTSAQRLLSVASNEIVGKPVEQLGSRLADLLLRTLDDEPQGQPLQWTDPLTQRTLSVQAYSFNQESFGIGAMAIIEDLTAEQLLRQKQERLERASFWTELAASMSHQIRNPLVAIRTFAQLLPERYDDPEFRHEFWKLVPQEVDRLNKMIDLITNFAHPPELRFQPLDLQKTVQSGVDMARLQLLPRNVEVDIRNDTNIPTIQGDENALAECLSHLVINAVEATSKTEHPSIILSVRALGDIHEGVAITVEDNGHGIPPDIRDKVFSPFCTTKALGMGLGLPIVQRTVLDHTVRIMIDSGEKGTRVKLLLPMDYSYGQLIANDQKIESLRKTLSSKKSGTDATKQTRKASQPA